MDLHVTLLRFRAFRRSAAISSLVWLLVYFVPSTLWYHYWSFNVQFDVILFAINLGAVIAADYVSLFLVRRFLDFARKRPIGASILSSIVGLVVVAAAFFILVFTLFLVLAFVHSLDHVAYAPLAYFAFAMASYEFLRAATDPTISIGMSPAFIIHLWLPLFALSSLIVQLIFWIFRAVEWAQWALKQGDAHPLQAIGIVAAIIVFGSAMLVKEGWTVL